VVKITFPGEFKDVYMKSGISLRYTEYMKKVFTILSITLTSTSITSALLHHLLFRLTIMKLVFAVFSLSLIVCCSVAFALFYYPLHRRNRMRTKMEDGLVFTLGYMTILSAGGVSIDRIFDRVSEVEDNLSIKQIAVKFMVNIRLLGFDIISSLKDVSSRSPSDTLSKLMTSISNTIQTKGDLRGLLSYEFMRQLQWRRDKMKKIMGTQNILGEIYVTLLIVAPILFILMFTILSILGSSFGRSPVLQLNLMVFFGMPVMALGFLIILDTVLGGDD